MKQKIRLSPKKILNKEFSVEFKGYNATEVDYFLDMVVVDYENFAALLNDAYQKIEDLETENSALKEKIEKLSVEKTVQEDNIKALEEKQVSNIDILRRISLLENAVFNKQ